MSIVKSLTDNGKPFIRLLGGIVLLAYMYRIIKAVITETAIGFDGQDWTILSSCLGIWVAYEVVVAVFNQWIKKRG